MTLEQVLTSIKSEVPLEWSKRIEFLEALEKLEMDAHSRPEIKDTIADRLVATVTRFINVPALPWQTRIYNLVANASKITTIN